jgi:hypothetical protein
MIADPHVVRDVVRSLYRRRPVCWASAARPRRDRLADTAATSSPSPADSSSAPFVGLNTAGVININGVPLPNNATSGVTGSLIEVRNGGRVRMP